MKITRLAQTLFVASGAWLIISGISELTTTSKGNEYGSWADETSFMALGMRSNGSLKVGLGIGLLGAASLSNTSTNNTSTGNSPLRLPTTELLPKSQPSDGTSEGDFAACYLIYCDRGGKEVAVISNTWTDGKTLTLGDENGRRLGIFSKNDQGEWYMTGMNK